MNLRKLLPDFMLSGTGRMDANAPERRDAACYSGSLSYSEVFGILENPRRRITLSLMLDNTCEWDLSDLAESVAVIEHDCDFSELTSQERKSTYVGLYQTHLPKMDGVGLVDFDNNRGDVALTDEARELAPLLPTIEEEIEEARDDVEAEDEDL